MKNIKKALALFVALTTVAMSTSAFADVTGAFDKDAVTADYTGIGDNTVKATVDMAKATSGTEATFVILDRDTVDANIPAEKILYLDQKTLATDDNVFTGVINLGRIAKKEGEEEDFTALPVGSYPIKVGYYNDVNTFSIAKATMVVADDAPGLSIIIKWGDTDGNGTVNGADASSINGGILNLTVATAYPIGEVVEGTNFKWGDTDGNGTTNSADASSILGGILGLTVATAYPIGSEVDIAAIE